MINLHIVKSDITNTIVNKFEHSVGNNCMEGIVLLSRVGYLLKGFNIY